MLLLNSSLALTFLSEATILSEWSTFIVFVPYSTPQSLQTGGLSQEPVFLFGIYGFLPCVGHLSPSSAVRF